MVYLDIYDKIFYYLEEKGIVDNVIEYSEEILKALLPRLNNDLIYNECVLEFALFNYFHEELMLIEFLSKTLYKRLDNDEKKEFDLISNSERLNIKFQKKVSTNKRDTHKKLMYDFYFEDLNNDEVKIIVSSSNLDEFKEVVNVRLIDNPAYIGKYSIIGMILDKESYEAVRAMSSLSYMKNSFENSKEMARSILEFSKQHSLAEIEQYKNKKSRFIKQDKRIMKINRAFFEKFGIGFNDFLNDFFKLSNDNAKFIEMAGHYMAILKELEKEIMDTNYLFGVPLIFEEYSIRGFLAFIKGDYQGISESIVKLQNEAKNEFDNSINNAAALSRENIIKNQKKFLEKNIAPLNIDGFERFFNKIGNYSPQQIEIFLEEITDYLKKNIGYLDEKTAFSVAFTENLLENADEIPYLDEVAKEQENKKYVPERFYEYIYADDRLHSLHIFLLAADYIQKKELNKACELIEEAAPAKTNSFAQMFLFGKVLSFFDNEKYKKYFKIAKENDKAKYQIELKLFLQEKEQKLLNLK